MALQSVLEVEMEARNQLKLCSVGKVAEQHQGRKFMNKRAVGIEAVNGKEETELQIWPKKAYSSMYPDPYYFLN